MVTTMPTYGRSRSAGASVGERRILLDDGRTVALRGIRPSDEARLSAFHDALSLETVANRFFVAHPHLTAEEVRHFTHLERGARRGATVAVDGSRIVGVGRFEPTSDDRTAELGLVVADDYQRVGLGTALFHVVARDAASAGYERLVAEVLSTNYRMLRLLLQSGCRRSVENDGMVTTVTTELEGRD